MNGEARNPNDPMGSPTAPHPVLKKYYEGESERRPFVRTLFDDAAEYYDWVCALGSFGSGQHYRHSGLVRSGLGPGMRLLDVATGTGLVARGAPRISRAPWAVMRREPRGRLFRSAKSAPSFSSAPRLFGG